MSPTTAKNLRNTYIAPTAPYLKPIVICGIIMALSSRSEVLEPLAGSQYLRYATWVQNGLFYVLFGAHAVETAVFTKRLNANGVEVLSMAWFKWMATCFVGGKFCFEHFDKVARQVKA